MVTFSDRISVQLPAGWHNLTSRQLQFVYALIASGSDASSLRLRCLLEFGDISVIARVNKGYTLLCKGRYITIPVLELSEYATILSWLSSVPDSPVRIPAYKRHRAVDARLKDVTFGDYLACENYYQGFLTTRQTGLMEEMARILYRAPNLKLAPVFFIGVLYWWIAVKKLFASRFPHLFQSSARETEDNLLESGKSRLQDSVDAQIRALTKGDPTKENDVLQLNVWRALTELDAQAREYFEYKKKYGK